MTRARWILAAIAALLLVAGFVGWVFKMRAEEARMWAAATHEEGCRAYNDWAAPLTYSALWRTFTPVEEHCEQADRRLDDGRYERALRERHPHELRMFLSNSPQHANTPKAKDTLRELWREAQRAIAPEGLSPEAAASMRALLAFGERTVGDVRNGKLDIYFPAVQDSRAFEDGDLLFGDVNMETRRLTDSLNARFKSLYGGLVAVERSSWEPSDKWPAMIVAARAVRSSDMVRVSRRDGSDPGLTFPALQLTFDVTLRVPGAAEHQTRIDSKPDTSYNWSQLASHDSESWRFTYYREMVRRAYAVSDEIAKRFGLNRPR